MLVKFQIWLSHSLCRNYSRSGNSQILPPPCRRRLDGTLGHLVVIGALPSQFSLILRAFGRHLADRGIHHGMTFGVITVDRRGHPSGTARSRCFGSNRRTRPLALRRGLATLRRITKGSRSIYLSRGAAQGWVCRHGNPAPLFAPRAFRPDSSLLAVRNGPGGRATHAHWHDSGSHPGVRAPRRLSQPAGFEPSLADQRLRAAAL